MGLDSTILAVTVWILPVLFAVTMHEAAHGYVASMLGDNTARMMGRVTLNPFKHVDPVGTILLPALCLLVGGGRFLFGYAKPVPVNFRALRHPRRDSVLVALAGPATNILLAVISLALLNIVPHLPPRSVEWTERNLVNSAWMNVVLAIFNMMPIPPMDGGRVAVGILPRFLALPLARLERSGMLLVLFLLLVLPALGRQFGVDLDFFRTAVVLPAERLIEFLAALVGVQA